MGILPEEICTSVQPCPRLDSNFVRRSEIAFPIPISTPSTVLTVTELTSCFFVYRVSARRVCFRVGFPSDLPSNRSILDKSSTDFAQPDINGDYINLAAATCSKSECRFGDGSRHVATPLTHRASCDSIPPCGMVIDKGLHSGRVPCQASTSRTDHWTRGARADSRDTALT